MSGDGIRSDGGVTVSDGTVTAKGGNGDSKDGYGGDGISQRRRRHHLRQYGQRQLAATAAKARRLRHLQLRPCRHLRRYGRQPLGGSTAATGSGGSGIYSRSGASICQAALS
ncbi:MAG: hypothetical protein ACLUGP_12895 [Faecalibacterium prausnitzii]